MHEIAWVLKISIASRTEAVGPRTTGQCDMITRAPSRTSPARTWKHVQNYADAKTDIVRQILWPRPARSIVNWPVNDLTRNPNPTRDRKQCRRHRGGDDRRIRERALQRSAEALHRARAADLRSPHSFAHRDARRRDRRAHLPIPSLPLRRRAPLVRTRPPIRPARSSEPQNRVGARTRGASDSSPAGCVVLGEPAYYGRFSFRARGDLTLPGFPTKYFHAIAFGADFPRGVVTYHLAFSASE